MVILFKVDTIQFFRCKISFVLFYNLEQLYGEIPNKI